MTDGLPVLAHPLPRPALPGRPDLANAAAVVAIIARGVELARCGAALALCTNPINKKALQDGAGFAFPGHTEFLAHLSGAALPVMMLAAPGLRVVPVDDPHPARRGARGADARAPRGDAPGHPRGARRRFRPRRAAHRRGRAQPARRRGRRDGARGDRRDRARSSPASRAEGIAVTGPHSADTLFHPAARARYDAAVCMYHDQALIPIKTVDFDGGVNVTLGLDFVRTSPDHGTAYDIAGTGRANPASLIAALELARAMGETPGRAAR